MSKPRRRAERTIPAAVEVVRRRIEEWRATRVKRTRMPEDLWDAAAGAARDHGLWFVSRALRVNYESLKQRAKSASEGSVGASFVEVPAAACGAAGATIIELSSGDGARLTVRFERQGTVDVPALAAAFWQRRP